MERKETGGQEVEGEGERRRRRRGETQKAVLLGFTEGALADHHVGTE